MHPAVGGWYGVVAVQRYCAHLVSRLEEVVVIVHAERQIAKVPAMSHEPDRRTENHHPRVSHRRRRDRQEQGIVPSAAAG